MAVNKTSGMMVLTTVGKKSDAKKIAEILVRGGFAACVNLIAPVESHYAWKGKIHADREWLLLMKTTAGTYPRLEKKLQAIHPYECPEIIGIEMDRIAESYADWLAKGVGEKR